jgi:hypothetical protein
MPDYRIQTDIKYGKSTLIDIPALAAANEPWFNQSLTEVNDCVVRLGILEKASVVPTGERRGARALYGCLVMAVAACSGSSSTSPSGSGQPETPEPTPTPSPAPTPAPTPPHAGFERFVLTGDDAACPAEARGDCHSSFELLADGTVRMDAWGAPGAAVLAAQATEAEREDVARAVTAPGLLSLLGQAKTCADANQTESMLVRIAGTDHENDTGYCNDEPIQAARGAALRVAAARFPGHSLISPPF